MSYSIIVRNRVAHHKARRVAAGPGEPLPPAAEREDAEVQRDAPRMIGSALYVVILCGLEIAVTAVLALTLLDFAIGGSMREAMRYTVVDAPVQFGFIVVALALACAAVRFAAEANIELVLPELFDMPGNTGLLARVLPRALAFIIGFSIGYPLLHLGLDQLAGQTMVLGKDDPELGWRAAAFGATAIAIGAFIAARRSLHRSSDRYAVGHASVLFRIVLALIPLAAMIALLGTVLDLFPGDIPGRFLGIAHGAVERYSGSDNPAYHMVVEGFALFLCAVVVRVGLSVMFGLIAPSGMQSLKGWLGWIPRLAAAAVGFAAAYELATDYAHATLAPTQTRWFYAIVLAYIAIAVLASLVYWRSAQVDDTSTAAHRIGGRWRNAADRVAALDISWRRFFMLMPLIGIALFVFFMDTREVARAQTLGPIAVLLLWGFAATALFAPIAYLSQMTKMPLLVILLVAGVAFAGFDLNDNHQIRGASTWHTARHHVGDQGFYRERLEIGEWLKSRRDWRAYAHYPIFLVATEGGGIRAAYFTATVLDAIEQKCPGFAQHVIALSSVSGGSVGSAVFAGQSAGEMANTDKPGCRPGAMKPGAELTRARDILSTDLLSPLLGASLFPDALQRILPLPIRSFDRARALEYALEDGWRRANTGCKGCDPERMSEPVVSLYASGEPRKPVPHLFLNTTEAGTGLSRPFATWDIGDLAVPERSLTDEERQALPRSTLVPVQNLMRRDDVALSTASMLSARFPYLTPAAKLGNTGHYVDGGYFENSGTWLLSGIAQNLIGQRLDYVDPDGDKELEQAVQNSILIVVVIRSEPCTRAKETDGCDEEIYKGDADSTWNEVLSPLRALLATRDKRSEYSVNDLGAMTALIQRLTGAATVTTQADRSGTSEGMQCNEILCQVTMRLYNAPGAEIPLTWMLSSRARQSMDNAVQRILDEDLSKPPHDIDQGDRIEGSYRQVLCLLQEGVGQTLCPVTPAKP